MTMVVQSYVGGGWRAPSGGRAELLDAATGEPVATVGTDPIDMLPVLDHARSVGGPALRELTFHARAPLLKQLAEYLNEQRDAVLRAVAWTGATGATRASTSTAASARCSCTPAGQAGAARRHDLRRRCRRAARQARHVRGPAPLHAAAGVAVQINAFNFPVWGLLEKFGAGVPGRGAHRS